MELTIKSRKLNSAITFSRPSAGYIFVDLNGLEGVLGHQICHRGRLMGNTISYSGDDQKQFEKICRRWYNAYITKNSFY